MKKVFLIILISVIAISCNDRHKDKIRNERFSKELQSLKEYFQIPGLTVLIKHRDQTIYEDYLGVGDINQQIPMDSTTTIPMASLTKIFSSILIWQLVEEEKITLNDPINKYVNSRNIADSIQIRHALSHTAQGILGQNFYYNNSRFMWLGEVIEVASGQNFKSRMYEKIIEPLGLDNTYLLQDSSQVANENRKIAQPYFLGGEMKDGYMKKEIKDGFIDYGYSAAAGIASTVHDLAKLSKAMDNGALISNASRVNMFTPVKPDLEYGLGIFSQEFMNVKLIWGYGQYDCYSSLFLKIPERDLVFIVAANNNLMSDPAHLIFGNVTTSLFALSFLKNYVYNLESVPLFEDQNTLKTLSDRVTSYNNEFYRQKLIAQAIAASYMSRYDDVESKMSKNILNQVFETFSDYKSYGDLILMHNLYILKFMDSLRETEEFVDFDSQFIGIGQTLFTVDRFNPYPNYYMAKYYQGKSEIDSTTFYYNRIINAKNFSPWWYTKEAQDWLDATPIDPF